MIVVNDGSKDKSLEIALSYKEKYPNTFIVIDKENGNYGSCINRGIKEANGKYFRIVDADDWVDTESLKKFIVKLYVCNAHLVFTNYSKYDSIGSTEVKFSSRIITDHQHNIESLDYEENDTPLQMHRMTYMTDIIRHNNLSLTEGVSYTDTEYCFFPLSFFNSVIFYDISLYQYLVERADQTMSEISLKRSTHSMYVVARKILHLFQT